MKSIFDEWIFRFGPAEYFATIIFVLGVFACLNRQSLWHSVSAILLGLLIGSIGLDVNSGVLRFTSNAAYEKGFAGGDYAALIVVFAVLIPHLSRMLLIATRATTLRWQDYWMEFLYFYEIAPVLLGIASLRKHIIPVALVGSLWAWGLMSYWFNLEVSEGFLCMALVIIGFVFLVLKINAVLVMAAMTYTNPLEENLRRALLLAKGDVIAVIERPLTAAILVVLVGIVLVRATVLEYSSRRIRVNASLKPRVDI
jgi:TctA family transporter